MSDRKVTDLERRMWESAARHVRRLDRGRPPRVSAPSATNSQLFDAPSEPPNAPLTPQISRQAPVKRTPQTPAKVENRQNERRIRRGKHPVSASIDLHGMTQDEAWRALPSFLKREQARGSQCVIVITGKGRSGEGVLRRNFLHWLDMPDARSLITGYAPAHARHGGGGAWYVFLKKS